MSTQDPKSKNESISCSVISDSLEPHGLLPTRLLRPRNFPGKNTEVGFHFLVQGNLPDPGTEPASPILTGGFFTTEPPGKPIYYTPVYCTALNTCSEDVTYFNSVILHSDLWKYVWS